MDLFQFFAGIFGGGATFLGVAFILAYRLTNRQVRSETAESNHQYVGGDWKLFVQYVAGLGIICGLGIYLLLTHWDVIVASVTR